MIKWIKKIFRRLGRDDSEDYYPAESDHSEPMRRRPRGPRVNIGFGTLGSKIATSSDSDDIQTDEVFSFKVFSAGGGKIIEFRSYDRVKDKSNNRLHIIGEDEDFATELGKIVLFELMRS